MKNQINVGVVGCGYWGPNLIRNFGSLPECNVRLACDSKIERLDHIKKMYPNLEVSEKFEKLVNAADIDAIVVATPVWTHYELAKKALQNGKHVFIEKPMASTSAQCRELNALAAQKDLIILVGHTYLYSSPVKMIKEIVDSSDFGPLLYISSQRLNLGLFQNDINVAWDLAPHDISMILHIMGDLPQAINCQGKAHYHESIEDVTNMSLAFTNGGFATIQSSWLDPNKVRRMTFVGKQQMILFDDNEPLEKIKIYDKRVEAPPHYDTYAEFHYSYHYGDMHAPYINQVEPLKTECQHFLDCIRNGTEPLTSGKQGLQVIQILEAANESLKNGGSRVEIKIFDEQAPKAFNENLKATKKYA
jgi:predicted dehydrogenase